MIVSANPTPELSEFDALLKKTLFTLNSQIGTSANKIDLWAGTKLEYYAADIMKEHAFGTAFENSIECTSGQSFPDIIAKKLYGVEVKTTIKNHWKTTGNSVKESSRIEDVERIFILFGKLGDPIEFRYRSYEECLSEVVVTHSPRYLIDMNLEINKTIFDKIGVPYDVLRKQENPIKNIVEYYKKGLKKGDDLWWIDSAEPQVSNLIIKLWTNLDDTDKSLIISKAYALFPELLSNNSEKYGRLALWLVTKQGVVCPSLRDTFSAGGKIIISTKKNIYPNAPRILYNLTKNISGIFSVLTSTSAEDLSEYWGYHTSEGTKIKDWINLVSLSAMKLKDPVANRFLQIIEELS